MNYFLAKTEPSTYSIDDLERDQRTAWDGVTNAQAVRVIRTCAPVIGYLSIIAAGFPAWSG